MIRKIHWTEDEHEQVLVAALALYLTGRWTRFEAIKHAQKALPEERQRTLLTASTCTNMSKVLYERSLLKPSKPLAIGLPTALDSMPSEPPSTPPEPPVIGDTLDDLVGLIAKHIAQTFKTQIKAAVKELEHEYRLLKHDPAYASSSIYKPRVVIIGLLADQGQIITQQFPNLHIRCIDVTRANGMNPVDADAYLLMKNFISHPLYHKYRGFPNHVLIDGGMTTLRAWLNTKGSEL